MPECIFELFPPAGAVLYQLSYQGNWEQVVKNIQPT